MRAGKPTPHNTSSDGRDDHDLIDRARRRRRRREGNRSLGGAVSFAPMIDMTFLLLIFFLVTTTFERAEGILASKLPQQSHAPAVALPLSPIVVRISQVGPNLDDYAITLDGFEDTPADFVELRSVFRKILKLPGFDTETPVVILAGGEVAWDHVVACWNAALATNFTRVAFGEPS